MPNPILAAYISIIEARPIRASYFALLVSGTVIKDMVAIRVINFNAQLEGIA